jgi:hypothetical protein
MATRREIIARSTMDTSGVLAKQAQEQFDAWASDKLDPNSPNYAGPGYAVGKDRAGNNIITIVDPDAQYTWEQSKTAPQAPEIPAVPVTPIQTPSAATPRTVNLNPFAGMTSTSTQRGAGFNDSVFKALEGRTDRVFQDDDDYVPARALQIKEDKPDPASEPAKVDRDKIDEILKNVNVATSGLLGIAQSKDKYSAAQAQLAIGTEDAQRAALGQARSGSRRDRSMLERTAIAEGATLASDAGRSAALLRAQEEDAEKKLRLDAYKAAGDLGLNVGALEVDVNRLDMGAATNYLNQVFESDRHGLTIDQAEAERITNFTRDMALISKDYYALGMVERQAIREDLTRRYGISQEVGQRMAELDAQPGFWEKAALGLVQAAPSAIAIAATASDENKKEKTSDANAKTGVGDAESELEDLLAKVGAKTWQYKDPGKDGEGRFAGPMAQDLQRSEVGKSMVSEGPDGMLQVDGARAGLAALSGLALVNRKLKELEDSL